MNGADFGTSELIYSENIIINGFHFPYPLNGTTEGMHREWRMRFITGKILILR